MERLQPIPTPLPRRLHNLCVRGLPIVAFASALCGVIALWPFAGAGRSTIGVAEGPRSTLVTPQTATVAEFLVPPHAAVQRGDPIAVLRPFDPGARLDLLRSRIDLARLASTPSLAEENAVQLERLRIDLTRTRTELAIARVRLDLAERDVSRNEPLFRDRLVAADIFDLTRSTRDLLKAEVEEKTRAVEAVELSLRRIESTTAGAHTQPVDPALLQELAVLQQSATTHEDRITLHAPIDGILGEFLRQPGEIVVEGESIVTIQNDRANRIVAFVRQPFLHDPQPGLEVIVTRRTAARTRFTSTIRHVGPQFETITNALAFIREGALVDAGLPIILDVPDPFQLRPGELVDLIIRPASKVTTGP